MGRDEWTSVLKLSTLWGFRELKQRALDALAQMPIHPADKVVLAREYDVERWLVDGYMELVKRDTGLSSEEKKKLGYESSLRVYEKREDTFRRGLQFQQSQYLSGYTIVNGSRVFDNLEAEIRGLFWQELPHVWYDEVPDAPPTRQEEPRVIGMCPGWD